jgi:A/G-specific adenine glycosylase
MDFGKSHKSYFTKQLINWHRTDNERELPWKSEKDPYKIWLSEIILQQTRAQQGLPYYLNFTKTYPTIKKLAAAKDEDVFRLWQGLGYYNRCRNMLATARYISNELKGRFPDTYEHILALKGIGTYTAAAIASFAYGKPYAVVDGNVYRVLARYFGIELSSDSTEGKKLFQSLAAELLYADDSAAYNQAIMDLGATICTPKKALCADCPLHKNCIAFKQDMIELLPVRTKKLKVKTRYFNYLVLKKSNRIWIQQRNEKDIWQSLHEPFLIETPKPVSVQELVKNSIYKGTKIQGKPRLIDEQTQKLSHQTIKSSFFLVDIGNIVPQLPEKGNWVTFQQLEKIAFPKTIVSFLEKKLYF